MRPTDPLGDETHVGDAATTEEDVVAEEMQREPTVEDLCPEGSYARLTAEVDAINRRLNSPTDQERAEDNEAALHVVSVSGPVQLTQKCVNGRMVLLSRDQVAAKLGPWIVDVVLQVAHLSPIDSRVLSLLPPHSTRT
eukprot:scaffold8103_cov403-Prasinococcus_capsulatus_cf.AAC.10